MLRTICVFSVLIFGSLLFGQQPNELPPPVPVFQQPPPLAVPPPKDGKVVPVPDDAANLFLMPSKFVKNRVEAMQVSTAGYITVQGLKVDSYRRCWLDPQQTYNKKSDRNVVLITRDEGGYHVILEEISHQWEAADFDPKGWLPVKTVRAAAK